MLGIECGGSFGKFGPFVHSPQKGWECPKCESILAPWLSFCDLCEMKSKDEEEIVYH